ncbi:MAG: tetratricopeptide repeat-containing protein [Thermodesulfobacterium geofontis]|uniref:Tetratricopeptide repeat-containing protein n=1 Tax=Thermodesulfobacterium geofontis TaxID=1295609 RepID=A0A2N7PLY0_9BACT|nr:MAG: tetratricopeptide repeat-containing protein [Thermodesulfobacterium geofontis]
MDKTILKNEAFLNLASVLESLKPAYELCIKAYQQWKEGRILDTIQFLEEALQIFQKNNAYKEIANILDFLGDLYSMRGNFEKALKAYKACLDICEDFEDEFSTAIVAEKIVHLYREKKDYEKMLPYLYRILEIAEKYRDAHRAARAMVGIGDVYSNKKDYQTAKEAYEIALKIYRGLGAKELAEIVEGALKDLDQKLK